MVAQRTTAARSHGCARILPSLSEHALIRSQVGHSILGYWASAVDCLYKLVLFTVMA